MLVAKVTRACRKYFSHIWLHPRYESWGGGKKKRKKNNPFYILLWLPPEIYLPSKSGEFGFSFSFSFSHDCIGSKIIFFHAEIWQQFASKRNTVREEDSRVSQSLRGFCDVASQSGEIIQKLI